MAVMDGVGEPTLEEDEAALAGYADALVDAIDAIAEPWLAGLITQHSPGLADEPEVQEATAGFAETMVTALRNMLARDIADQTSGPLEIMRQSVGFATMVLADVGTPAVERGDFETRNFPDDAYDLTPGSFADIHPDLHTPGLMWGAAKAHVHLRRRREAANNS